MRDIKVLHLEPTDVCQAACALCARETDKNFRKDRQHHLSIDQILRVFDQEKIQQLDKSICLVSHRDELAGRVENILKVVKENGFTSYNTDVDIA